MLGFLLWLRHKLYDSGVLSSWTPPVPLIGIGNLELGGTGKTPFTIYLANLLKHQFSIGIVNHGYKLKSKKPIIASEKTKDLLNEEALLIWLSTGQIPLVSGRNRKKAILSLLAQHPEINLLIADDILQHRKINPHVSILLTPYDKPYYKNRLMPLGTLRDIKSRAKAIPVLVYTYSPVLDNIDRPQIKKLTPWHELILFAHPSYKEPKAITSFTESGLSRAIAICGIARPKNFLSHVKNHYEIVNSICFRDHKEYTVSDVENIILLCHRNRVSSIITTEKDAIKLRKFKKHFEDHDISVFYLPLSLILHPDDEQLLLTYLSEKITAHGQK